MDTAVLKLVWGEETKSDVFTRWIQGFQPSADEPLALVQHSGGPCAVLAPVQAFMIQHHLFSTDTVIEYDSDEWRKCVSNDVYLLLLYSLCDMLVQAASSRILHVAVLKDKQLLGGPSTKDSAITRDEGNDGSSGHDKPTLLPSSEDQAQGPSSAGVVEGKATVSSGNDSTEIGSQVATLRMDDSGTGEQQQQAAITSGMLAAALQSVGRALRTPPFVDSGHTSTASGGVVTHLRSDGDGHAGVPGEKRPRLDLSQPPTAVPQSALPEDAYHKLHSNIRFIQCYDQQQALSALADHFTDYQGSFGILLFLYSVILTKGVDNILDEVEDRSESLIDATHGHGSQSLVNLLLTGRAVVNVFDMEREVCGLELKGIGQQSAIGFLTILEALRYCQVGCFLKSPKYPVWVIGSETHLTVAFSTERNLVAMEPADAAARRAFRKFDKEDDNFIATDNLDGLLRELDLETDPEYLSFMKQKLDSDELGIILLNNFLDEFFPESGLPHIPPKSFIIYHYNGLLQSSSCGKVQFVKGNAVVLDEDTGMSSDVTLLNCLHTKWPGLVVTWENRTDPSIN